MQQGPGPSERLDPDEVVRQNRRQALAKIGAAGTIVWAAPVISSIGSAAAAASPCIAPDMGFGAATGENGWSQSQTGDFGGGIMGVANYGDDTLRFVFEPDATSSDGASLSYSKDITLQQGRTYVFGFSTYVRTINAVTETLRVFVGATQVFTTDTASGVADGSTTPHTSDPYVASVTGDVVFRYELSLPTNGVGDDIGVSAPTVLCT
ncbi:hypothetical protein BH10ACT1_BH10ACT1_41630 [soil metagenome]